MTVYFYAYRADGSQILGNLDMQTSYVGVRDYRRTMHYKALRAGNYSVSRAVAFWRIVDGARNDAVLETIRKREA